MREWLWSGMQLLVTGRVPPSNGGLACNPTYFSAVSQAVTVPNILVSILWSFYIMGSVKPVLVVVEACVIG